LVWRVVVMETVQNGYVAVTLNRKRKSAYSYSFL